MRKFESVTIYALLILTLAGCTPFRSLIKPTASPEKTVSKTPLPQYLGPKAKITVTDFDVKATKAGGDIGSGLREMLLTALINSNRFSVVERQAGGADLIITAAVTEFEPEGSGGRQGLGGGGGVGSGRLGGLLGTSLNKARMALDIRIVDASNSKILAVNLVQGQASDISGSSMSSFFGSSAQGIGLSAYANTPMEKAIHICIIEAVRYISKATPENYYKE